MPAPRLEAHETGAPKCSPSLQRTASAADGQRREQKPAKPHPAPVLWAAQSGEQPSPPTRSPSSQRSPSSTRPFPQDDADSGSEGAFRRARRSARTREPEPLEGTRRVARGKRDRKSTRLNSSHVKISYAVSCLQ